jgi:hypothetical protein
MSHDQSATAFHFLISNFFVGAVADDAAADAASAMVCTSILCGALFKKHNNNSICPSCFRNEKTGSSEI